MRRNREGRAFWRALCCQNHLRQRPPRGRILRPRNCWRGLKTQSCRSIPTSAVVEGRCHGSQARRSEIDLVGSALGPPLTCSMVECCVKTLFYSNGLCGAAREIRTPDPIITNDVHVIRFDIQRHIQSRQCRSLLRTERSIGMARCPASVSW